MGQNTNEYKFRASRYKTPANRLGFIVNCDSSAVNMSRLNRFEKLQLANALLATEQEHDLQALIVAYMLRRRWRRRQRRYWMHQWLMRRPLYGIYEKLVRELEIEDPERF